MYKRFSFIIICISLLLGSKSVFGTTNVISGNMTSTVTGNHQYIIDIKNVGGGIEYIEQKTGNYPDYNLKPLTQDIENFKITYSKSPNNTQDLTDADANTYRLTTWNNPGVEKITTACSFNGTLINRLAPLDSLTAFPVPQTGLPTRYLEPTSETQSNHSEIINKAKELTTNAKYEYEAVKAIQDWIIDNITWTDGVLQDALSVLQSKKGNCQGFSHLAVALLRAVKIPAKFVAGGSISHQYHVPGPNINYLIDWGQGTHGWIEVYYPDKGWIPYEPQLFYHYQHTHAYKIGAGRAREDVSDGQMSYSYNNPPPTIYYGAGVNSSVVNDNINFRYVQTLPTPNKIAVASEAKSQPDLEATDIWTVPSSLVGDQSCVIHARITNIGNAPVPATTFYTKLYIDGSLKETYPTNNGISVGGYIQPKYGVSLPAGTHTIKIVTDATSVITETNENNNERSETFTWSALPDLVVTNLTINPSTPVGAQPTTITWRVDNDGSVDIPITTRFYTKLIIDETPVKTWCTDGLKTTQYISEDYTGNFKIGNHTVKVITDETKVVSEANEDNNKKEEPFTVIRIQSPANLSATTTLINTVKLTWNWNYDNSVLYGFYIYRDKESGFTPSISNYIGYASKGARGYEDTSILGLGTYYYKVTAVDWYSSPPDDKSIPSNEARVIITPSQDTTQPSVPTNLNVTNPAEDNGTHLNLTWTASTDNVGVAYYRVYESTSPNVSKEVWDAFYDKITKVNLQANKLTRGVKYYYKVLAVDTSRNESELSNRAEGIPKDTRKPNPPTNLSAVGNDGYVSLIWDYSSDAWKWNIYRKPGINTTDYEKIEWMYSNAYTDYRVTNGVTYYYKVRAESYEGIESNDSNIVQVMPTVADLPPSAPTKLASYADDRAITLIWERNQDSDLAGYNVYRNGTKLTPTPILQTIYENSGLTNDITYHYEVRSVDQAGNESLPASINAIPHPVSIKIVSINGYEPGTYYTNTKDP
ncbi:MAG: transglutaminase domain-containing protein, partial [bacterium]|nr:transglutaminase domain-containing protein [bacterium]